MIENDFFVLKMAGPELFVITEFDCSINDIPSFETLVQMNLFSYSFSGLGVKMYLKKT